MNKRIWLAAAAAGLLVFTTSTPSSAEGSAELSKQAQQAASIDELRASDAQLTEAIATLDKEVGAQSASVASAQQALEAANQKLASAEKAILDIEERMGDLRRAATERAIQEYIRPQDDLITRMFSSEGFDEASRRSELMAEVAGRDYEALEELRAARDDLENRRRAAVDAQKIASERKADAQQKLDLLNAARADKAKLEASLQERIKAYASEDDAGSIFAPTTNTGRASRSSSGATEGRHLLDRWPTSSKQVNSPFGQRWGRLHKGIDIEAKNGTPISATRAGTVVFAGWYSGYGNYTCIDHADGLSTCYAHQSRIVVSVGTNVESGQLIGYSGNTGSSAGAHLHFETYLNGGAQDPKRFLP